MKWPFNFLLASLPLCSQAGLLVPTSTGSPDPKVLSIREMAIDVGISRGYARVNIRQIFENHTGAIQEGTYRFALPPSASVGDFAVWDDLQRIPGVIMEKRRARSIYKELTRQKIDPGLLQQGEEEDHEPGSGDSASRPDAGSLFSVTVAPIPAMATKRLEILYHQEVPYIASQGEFRLLLKPPEDEAPVVGKLTVNVTLEEGAFEAVAAGLPMTFSGPSAATHGSRAAFAGSGVKLDRDLVFRIHPKIPNGLQLSAFRNPEGRTPDGLALAPWERPFEIPLEKDGFFLLEALLPGKKKEQKTPAPAAGPAASRTVALLFESSLAHRWGGLEAAYGHLMRVLGALREQDRFLLVPFARQPARDLPLQPATPQAIEAELEKLRQRPLEPGSNVPAALKVAKKRLGNSGKILLLCSGQDLSSAKTLKSACQGLPLFTILSTGQARTALRNGSDQCLSYSATELETDLFFDRLLSETPQEPPKRKESAQAFHVTGGDPKLYHVYPVMNQPMEAGGLSGWVGRYGIPQANVTFTLPVPKALVAKGGESLSVSGPLPEKALEARDLPRRWARARVDDLLARIEMEGERREWVEEVIALSKRYKFVTPYTAFLAAPRSLLRPRRIQPGDPLLRLECDPGTQSVTALFPFGLKLALVRRPNSQIFEGRFLVPEGFPDGRHAVRILLRDKSGALIAETKHFILDGKAPVILPELPVEIRAGELLKVKAKTDADVVQLTARIGECAPVPLRWYKTEQCSSGVLRVPAAWVGKQEVFFEAVDGAKNRGFARGSLEVKP